MAIAIITAMKPIIIGVSKSVAEVFDCGEVGWVFATSETANDVSDCDGKYDSEPAKFAVTVKSPLMSGIQVYVNIPFELLVVVPIVR